MKLTRCIECGGTRFERSTLEHSVKVGGRRYVGQLSARRCTACGWAHASDEEVRRFDLQVAAHLARNGPMSGEGLAWMREALGLLSQELARLLGVTREHLSRWEHGRKPIDRNAWLVAGSLVLDALGGSRDTAQRLEATTTPVRKRRIDLGRASTAA